MTAAERQAAAAKVIHAHRESRDYEHRGFCLCDEAWVPLHVAKMLDEAGLLCALTEATP